MGGMAGVERIPPQNLEAEQSVLGAVLLDREAAERCVELLRPEDFYREPHRRIFAAVAELVARREAVDVITVGEQLARQGQLEAIGGLTYLSDLTASVPATANAPHYARIVADKAILRELLRAAAEIADSVYAGGDDPDAVLDEAEARIFRIAEARRSGRAFRPLKDILVRAFADLERLYEHKGEVLGTPTGLGELDRLTTGFHPAELIVLAARPSQGKTALALNIALAAAARGAHVGFFSLEMAAEQLALRLLCMAAGVAGERVRSGFLGEEDWPRLGHALGKLAEAPLYIDDTPNLSIMDLRARARRMRAECGVELLIVDYLQLIHSRGRAENRQQEIAEISRSLKALARELEIPVLALSQLSRAVEARENRRPQLSDLRESGAIEQDADVVIFIYQDPKLAEDPSRRYEMELIVAKQRNGPTGPVPVIFQRALGRFTDKPLRAG
jgi:replicative DNA helicase